MSLNQTSKCLACRYACNHVRPFLGWIWSLSITAPSWQIQCLFTLEMIENWIKTQPSVKSDTCCSWFQHICAPIRKAPIKIAWCIVLLWGCSMWLNIYIHIGRAFPVCPHCRFFLRCIIPKHQEGSGKLAAHGNGLGLSTSCRLTCSPQRALAFNTLGVCAWWPSMHQRVWSFLACWSLEFRMDLFLISLMSQTW